MKIKNIIICGIALIGLSACEKHEESTDLSLKEGSIYCADGSIVPSELYSEEMNGVGVIIYVGKEKGQYSAIAIGKEELGDEQFANTSKSIDGVSGDINEYNGKENTAALLSAANSEEKLQVPAATKASSYSIMGMNGWHLPSCGELVHLAQVKEKVNQSLSLIGGQILTKEWYISSTQDGQSNETKKLYCFCVTLEEGRIISCLKDEKHRVRPFIAIR